MSNSERRRLVSSYIVGFVSGAVVVGAGALCVLLFTIGPFLGPGSQDYSYDLSGGYRLHRNSLHEVSIDPTGPAHGKPRIGPKVVELAWDDRFILAERQSLGPDHQPVDASFEFWILETKTSLLFGPLDLEEFSKKRAELGVPAQLRLRHPGWYL